MVMAADRRRCLWRLGGRYCCRAARIRTVPTDHWTMSRVASQAPVREARALPSKVVGLPLWHAVHSVPHDSFPRSVARRPRRPPAQTLLISCPSARLPRETQGEPHSSRNAPPNSPRHPIPSAAYSPLILSSTQSTHRALPSPADSEFSLHTAQARV